MAGWTIKRLGPGGHEVLYLDKDGEEILVGIFSAEIPAQEVLDTVIASGEPGDWLIDAEGAPMIIAEAPEP